MKTLTAIRKPTDRSWWGCSVCKLTTQQYLGWADAVKEGWSFFTTVKTDYSLCPACSKGLIKLEEVR